MTKKFSLKNKATPQEKQLREQYKKFADLSDMVMNKRTTKKGRTYRRRNMIRKKKWSKRKFVKFAKKIKGCTEEIKQLVYNVIGASKRLCYTDRAFQITDLLNLVWPSAGTGEGQRIGEEIFIRYLVVEWIFTWDNTNFSDQPHRIIVLKSKIPSSTFNVGDILDASAVNGSDGNYVTKMYSAGTRVIYDKMVRCPPQLDLETAAADVESNRSYAVKKSFRIMKMVKRMSPDSNFFNIPFYLTTILRPPDISIGGTGPSVEQNIRIFYQDA